MVKKGMMALIKVDPLRRAIQSSRTASAAKMKPAMTVKVGRMLHAPASNKPAGTNSDQRRVFAAFARCIVSSMPRIKHPPVIAPLVLMRGTGTNQNAKSNRKRTIACWPRSPRVAWTSMPNIITIAIPRSGTWPLRSAPTIITKACKMA